MARLKRSSSNYPCEDLVAGPLFYALALLNTSNVSEVELEEIWRSCFRFLVKEFGRESVKKFDAFRKWPVEI
jgi:hypothetical protein